MEVKSRRINGETQTMEESEKDRLERHLEDVFKTISINKLTIMLLGVSLFI